MSEGGVGGSTGGSAEERHTAAGGGGGGEGDRGDDKKKTNSAAKVRVCAGGMGWVWGDFFLAFVCLHFPSLLLVCMSREL